MAQDRPVITPDLKVGEFLQAYPELEEVLIEIAPVFEKLRNPLLRRTVAKLTTLRQAAQVGDVSLGQMISKLRVAAGTEEAWTPGDDAPDSGRPEWVDPEAVAETFDARAIIAEGGHPLEPIMKILQRLEAGQSCVVITPFVPAPMISVAEGKGFVGWSTREGPDVVKTYFTKRG